MKTMPTLRALAILALAYLSFNSEISTAFAQGTVITYQGRLDFGANSAEGIYDLRFTIYDALSGGSPVGGPLTNSPVAVSNGLFTVTLDFGAGVFTGAARWLEIGVRTNGGGAYTTLTPRQRITATPYAILSASAGSAEFLNGTVAASQLTGTIAASNIAPGTITSAMLVNGAALAELLDNDGAGSGLDADLLDGLQASFFWQLGGNAGTTAGTHFLGTSDNQPVEFKVNNLRALRLEDNGDGSDGGTTPDGAPNVIGGSPANSVAAGVVGATIGGGGATNFLGLVKSNRVEGDYSTIAGGVENVIRTGSRVAAIGGGGGNVIEPNAHESVISGGGGNTVQSTADTATISGGRLNIVQANADFAVIGGGFNHQVGTNSSFSVIGGGDNNQVWSNAAYGTIPGGQNNAATNYAFAAGRRAKANHTGAFVWADSQNADFASTATNQFLIRASGGVGIGETAPLAPLHVSEGSSGVSSVASSSIAVFERSSHSYMTVLAPTNSETGVLFGSPTHFADGGVLFNGNTPRGLEFRTGGNNVKMVVESGGDVGIGTTNPTNKLHVIGGATFASGSAGANQVVVWTPGSASWSFTSDRNAKDRIEPVNAQQVLEKVNRLTIHEWSYIGYNQRHIGPMAQDFHAQFPLNENTTALNDADLHGVALAAIQGLNEKVEDRNQKSETRIQKLETENAELIQTVNELKELIHAINKQVAAVK